MKSASTLLLALILSGRIAAQDVAPGLPVYLVVSESTVQQKDGSTVTFRQVVPPVIPPQTLPAVAAQAVPLTEAQEPAPPSLKERDDNWRRQELQRAEKLLDQWDFSPMDEAFEAKDLLLLWCYYVGSTELPIHLHPKYDARRLAVTRTERRERVKQLIERTEHAGRLLQKIPGHARFLGDLIEETLYGRGGGMNMQSTYISCLLRLGQDGSDECIEQLGRFLFDPRDPGFRPFDPAIPRSSPYDTRGVPNPVKNGVIHSLFLIIQPRFKVGISWADAEGLPLEGYEATVQNWWLTSAEAAPYRRSLAATGVVLPPGYPPMKELEGSACTIAPPLKNPPYPDKEIRLPNEGK